MAPRVLRRPAASARPRLRARQRLFSMVVVDCYESDGYFNRVFVDYESKGLITLETSSVSFRPRLSHARRAVYSVRFNAFDEETRASTGVAGKVVSVTYLRWISWLQYRRLLAYIGR